MLANALIHVNKLDVIKTCTSNSYAYWYTKSKKVNVIWIRNVIQMYYDAMHAFKMAFTFHMDSISQIIW